MPPVPPTFQSAKIILNRKPGKTSRFHVKGSNFTANSKVFLNGKECDRTNYVSPNLLAVALKFGSWPVLAPLAAAVPPVPSTGEIDVTITVKDGTATTPDNPVTVVAVNEDDLP